MIFVLGVGFILGLGGFSVTATYAHDEEPIEPPTADDSTWEVETCTADNECGDVGPLIPQTYNAVGSGMIWKSSGPDFEKPQIAYMGRHSEWVPTDVASEDCYEQLVLNSPIIGPMPGNYSIGLDGSGILHTRDV